MCGMACYGPDFAPIYARYWAFWADRLWPFLHKYTRERDLRATRWLDLCCGCGSLLELLRQHGCAAVGVDRSPAMLAEARRRVPGARLVRADMRRLRLRERFDVITCLFDSLNYLADPDELIDVLRRVRAHLADDGVFIFDVNTVAGHRLYWQKTTTFEDARRMIVVSSAFDSASEVARCRIVGFAREGRRWRRFEEVHQQRGFDRPVCEEALAVAGFQSQIFDGERFTRPRADAGRLIFVARPL